jgi:hypothetical protein
MLILPGASAMLAAGPSRRPGIPTEKDHGSLGERSNRMRANKTEGGSHGRSHGVGLPPGLAAIVLVSAWWVAGPAAGAAAAEVLRWKFQPGETLRFSIEQKSSMTAKATGTERKSTQTQTVEMSWKIQAVEASGEAEITQRMDRIRLRAEMPPLMPLDFDSAANKPDPPGFEPITRQVKALVGAEFSFKLKPNGEITDVKLSPETLKRLRETAPAGSPDAEFSEKAVKENLLVQLSPPTLPDGPIEPGQTWSPKPTRMPLPFATLVLEKTFTYQGPDPKSPNLMLVGIDTSVKIEPVEGVDIKATIRKQEGKGTMTFDGQAGRLANVRLSQKIDLSIVQMGQSMDQTTEMNISMSLLP